MVSFFTVLQVIFSILIVLLVLLQTNNSEGWSALSSSNSLNSFMAQRSSGKFLTKITTIIAVLFFLNSLLLSNLTIPKKNTIVDSDNAKIEKNDTPSVPIAE